MMWLLVRERMIAECCLNKQGDSVLSLPLWILMLFSAAFTHTHTRTRTHTHTHSCVQGDILPWKPETREALNISFPKCQISISLIWKLCSTTGRRLTFTSDARQEVPSDRRVQSEWGHKGPGETRRGYASFFFRFFEHFQRLLVIIQTCHCEFHSWWWKGS